MSNKKKEEKDFIMTKSKIFSDCNLAGFSRWGQGDTPIVDPTIRKAYYDLYSVDEMLEGLMCTVEVNEQGHMVLTLEEYEVQHFNRMKSDHEKWLDAIHEDIIGDYVPNYFIDGTADQLKTNMCHLVGANGKYAFTED